MHKNSQKNRLLEQSAYLSWQVKISVQWLDVLDCLSSDHPIIQQNLMVCGGLWDQMVADSLREPVRFSMQLRLSGDRRTKHVPKRM